MGKKGEKHFFLWFSAKDLMEIKVSGVNFFATLHWLNEGLQERTRKLALGEDKADKCQLCSLISFFLLDNWHTVKYRLRSSAGIRFLIITAVQSVLQLH